MHPLIQFIASLRLTVVLLGLGMMLVFFGTLDQVHTGIWETQRRYFFSFLVVWSYPREWWGFDILHFIRIPMPGGYLLGAVLFVNLISAHLARFRWSWRQSGIFLIHSGLLLLLLSEFLTSVIARESQMAITEGSRTYHSEDFRDNELVFIDRSHPEYVEVHRIPARKLARMRTIEHPELPFKIQPVYYFPNSAIGRRGENPAISTPPVNRGLGAPRGGAEDIVIREMPVLYDDQSINTVSAFIRLLSPENEVLGTWLVSNLFDERFPPQIVNSGDQEWEMALRFRRYYHSFGLGLSEFRFDRYPGTEIPKNFSSEVRILDPEASGTRTALIYMNHPLRYGGLTFYQASFDPETEATTILQVVRNPGWLLPYFSVLLLAAGMLLQFSMHLFRFQKRNRKGNS